MMDDAPFPLHHKTHTLLSDRSPCIVSSAQLASGGSSHANGEDRTHVFGGNGSRGHLPHTQLLIYLSLSACNDNLTINNLM